MPTVVIVGFKIAPPIRRPLPARAPTAMKVRADQTAAHPGGCVEPVRGEDRWIRNPDRPASVGVARLGVCNRDDATMPREIRRIDVPPRFPHAVDDRALDVLPSLQDGE